VQLQNMIQLKTSYNAVFKTLKDKSNPAISPASYGRET